VFCAVLCTTVVHSDTFAREQFLSVGCEVFWWVCLFVRQDIPGTTCAIFTNFFVHVACIRASVLLWHVYDRPHRILPGRGFPSPLTIHIYPESHARSLPNFNACCLCLWLGPVSDTFTIGRIAYRREWVFFPIENALSAGKGDGSAQRGRSICYLRLPCLGLGLLFVRLFRFGILMCYSILA